ncbi:MAG: PQQ-binding-like beta-propeller repeat protein [Deltaproteobacteria bacterium]|jgi:hypothetical protein
MRRLASALLIAAFASCGGPLDRVDGSLVLTLTGLPVEADLIDLELVVGERKFETTTPVARVIDVFSAVSAGQGTLSLTVRDGDVVLTRRVGIPVTIEADATVNVPIDFLAGPEIEVDAPEQVRVYERQRFDVEVVDRSFETSLYLTVHIDGDPIDIPARTSRGWLFDVDTTTLDALFPADVLIEIDACVDASPPRCTHVERTVRVHREVWRTELSARSSVAPAVVGDRVVTADDAGLVTVFDYADGAKQFEVQRTGPLLAGLGVVGDLVFVADADGEVVAIHTQTGTVSTWTANVGDRLPTDVVPFDGGVVLAAGERLTHVALDGVTRTLLVADSTIRARPFVDGETLVVADLDGNVTRLDAAGVALETVVAGPRVLAGPVRTNGVTWVGRTQGQLHPLGQPQLDVQEAVVHPIVVMPRGVALAAGHALVFASLPAELRFVGLGSPINAAPVRYGAGLLVGTHSGLWVAVGEDGRRRTLARARGVALAASVAPEQDVVTVDSTGEVVRLRAEEDFWP